MNYSYRYSKKIHPRKPLLKLTLLIFFPYKVGQERFSKDSDIIACGMGWGSPNQFGRLEKRLSTLSTLCWKAYFSPEKSGLNPTDTITSPILRRSHFTMFFTKSKVVKERIPLQENKMVVSDSIHCTEHFRKKLCICAIIRTWREVLVYSRNCWARVLRSLMQHSL